jgi:plasmid stabilization system protein ParE
MLTKAAKTDLKAIGRDTQAAWGRVQRSRYLTLLDEGLRALTVTPLIRKTDMSTRRQPRPTLYEQLEALPEGLTGEILNGQLYTQPRSSLEHGYTTTSLAGELVNPFQRGRGGPGGWMIVMEPELHFIRDTEVDAPDLAGWRRERLPTLPKAQHRALVVPVLICS